MFVPTCLGKMTVFTTKWRKKGGPFPHRHSLGDGALPPAALISPFRVSERRCAGGDPEDAETIVDSGGDPDGGGAVVGEHVCTETKRAPGFQTVACVCPEPVLANEHFSQQEENDDAEQAFSPRTRVARMALLLDLDDVLVVPDPAVFAVRVADVGAIRALLGGPLRVKPAFVRPAVVTLERGEVRGGERAAPVAKDVVWRRHGAVALRRARVCVVLVAGRRHSGVFDLSKLDGREQRQRLTDGHELGRGRRGGTAEVHLAHGAQVRLRPAREPLGPLHQLLPLWAHTGEHWAQRRAVRGERAVDREHMRAARLEVRRDAHVGGADREAVLKLDHEPQPETVLVGKCLIGGGRPQERLHDVGARGQRGFRRRCSGRHEQHVERERREELEKHGGGGETVRPSTAPYG